VNLTSPCSLCGLKDIVVVVDGDEYSVDDRVVGPVESSLVIAEKADEPLISDELAGRLGIVALDFGDGLWCFRDEIGRVTRRSR
jgi:hypothetical protein